LIAELALVNIQLMAELNPETDIEQSLPKPRIEDRILKSLFGLIQSDGLLFMTCESPDTSDAAGRR
jgi:hypothetical protein